MTRNQALGLGVIFLCILVLSVLAVALMPVWLPVLLIYPKAATKPANYVMHRVTREMMKMMFRPMGPTKVA